MIVVDFIFLMYSHASVKSCPSGKCVGHCLGFFVFCFLFFKYNNFENNAMEGLQTMSQ